ncbi:MAG TPA: pseudouridine synthase, partial [Blastocatellia bacterium]|nr:pseudouridine synthase [Blastocatellia bacterium]
FGFETDTGDRTGKRKTGSDLSDAELKKILRTVNWNKLLSGFCGEIRQVPPMHSAKKVGGKRLYSLARQGKEIERRAVPVTISALEILETAGDTTMKFRIVCSAGTYIRTLAEDIGRKAGTGAHLQELRRTRSGRFSLDDALDLAYLEEMACPETRLITMREALADLPEVILPDNRIEKTRQGLPTRISQPVIADGSAVKMIDENGSLAAIGIYENAEKNVWPKVVLI